MLFDENMLSKISSKYILKSIFYHLDYNHFLKLFKNNKTIQDKVGITLNDYKLQSNYPEYQYIEDFSVNHYLIEADPNFNGEAKLGYFCLLLCFTVLYFIYVLVYTLLLLIKDTFDDSTAQGDYTNKASTINIINACNFILLAGHVMGAILLFYYDHHSNSVSFQKGARMKIKIVLIIIYDLLFFSYEGIAIWKLILSYQIKKDGAFWFIIMDYVFIFLNFIYILLLFYISFLYFNNYYKFKKEEDSRYAYFISSLNGISVNNYHILGNFIDLNEKDKRKFVINNYKNMTYSNNNRQINLIKSINEFRKKNNLNELSKDNFKRIPDYIMKKYTEVEINKDENSFKLNNDFYLIKFLEGEFENKFKNNELDADMSNILRNKELNHIKIITKNNFEYIFLCKLSAKEFFENNNYKGYF